LAYNFLFKLKTLILHVFIKAMENYLKRYSIVFRGLEAGKHEFMFMVENKFFEHFPESEIKKGRIKVKVILQLKPNALIIQTLLKGAVKVACDLCLDEFVLEIKHKADLQVEFGEKTSDITDVDDKMTLSFAENEIEMAQHFYDYIHLSLPAKKVHKKDEDGKRNCNQEMIKTLNQFSINKQKSAKVKDEVDPRWEQLKDLYNKN